MTGAETTALLAPIAANLAGALIALDFDGTLAPLTSDPMASRPVPGVVATLHRLAEAGAQIAIVTGREAETVLELGGLHDIDRLIASGLHGAETWRAGRLSTLDEPAGMPALRAALPKLLPDRVWVEDKRLSLVVHTRQAADPERMLAELAEPIGRLAAEHGLDSHPGKLVLELRIPKLSKATALDQLLTEQTTAALFAGDDLGDLPALAAIRAWSQRTGRPGRTVAVGELPDLRAAADLALDTPAELGEALAGLLSEPSKLAET
jgi:trehalose 6-phosphate phosphatase